MEEKKKPSDEINDIYSSLVMKAKLMSRNKPINKTALRIFAIEEWLNGVFGEVSNGNDDLVSDNNPPAGKSIIGV